MALMCRDPPIMLKILPTNTALLTSNYAQYLFLDSHALLNKLALLWVNSKYLKLKL